MFHFNRILFHALRKIQDFLQFKVKKSRSLDIYNFNYIHMQA